MSTSFREAIEEIRSKAQRAILYIDSSTSPTLGELQPSEKGCKFCKAKAACPALQRTVQDAIGADFADLTEAVVGDSAATPDEMPSPETLELVEMWVKANRAEIERRLFDGQDVPLWKLVQGRKGARQWTDKEAAEQALKAMRLKMEEMYSFTLISPTTAEKLAKAGTIGPRQWPKLGELITQPEGSPSVAPASDKRPALVLTKPSADDFEAVEEDITGGLV